MFLIVHVKRIFQSSPFMLAPGCSELLVTAGFPTPRLAFSRSFLFFVPDSSTSASDQTFPPSSPYVASQLITQEKLAEDAA